MRNQKTIDLAYMAVFLTIIVILSTVPGLGFISLPFFPFIGGTIIHIPVLVASIYFGYRHGAVAGFFFGVASFYVALTRAAQPVEFVFRNPIVSVLPRILFPIFAVLVYQWVYKLTKKDGTSIAAASVAGTIIHSILVLFLLVVFGSETIAEVYGTDAISTSIIFNLTWTTLVFNSILESVLAGVIVTPIVKALKAMSNRDNHLIIEE